MMFSHPNHKELVCSQQEKYFYRQCMFGALFLFTLAVLYCTNKSHPKRTWPFILNRQKYSLSYLDESMFNNFLLFIGMLNFALFESSVNWMHLHVSETGWKEFKFLFLSCLPLLNFIVDAINVGIKDVEDYYTKAIQDLICGNLHNDEYDLAYENLFSAIDEKKGWLNRRATVNQRFCSWSSTLLHEAIQHNRLRTIMTLLRLGAHVNAKINRPLQSTKTPLELAAELEHFEAARILLDAGADYQPVAFYFRNHRDPKWQQLLDQSRRTIPSLQILSAKKAAHTNVSVEHLPETMRFRVSQFL